MRKVYFTIHRYADMGFMSQLAWLMQVRKLGLSLGYEYFHKRISCPRSAWRAQPLNWPWFLVRLISRIRRVVRISPGLARSAWDRLGLNHHLAREAKIRGQASPSECRQASIALGDRMLERNGISTLGELKAYVRAYVNQEISEENSSDRSLLLNISLSGSSDITRSMLKSIPDSIDDLDLPAICSERRHKRLRRLGCLGLGYFKAGYPKEGLKTLVHVRQGDVAAVRTPWKTWVYWPIAMGVRRKRWRECRDESEFNRLTVADYHRFVKGLGSRFGDNAFAVQFFSDGFERVFHEIYAQNNKDVGLRLTRERMNSLLKQRRRYAREFKILKEIKNSSLTVGEWPPGRFLKFFDAALTADLLIVAFPRQKTALHLNRRFSPAPVTPVILLHKPVSRKSLRDFLENNPSDKMIAVDISAPDFDRVAARLVELLPSLGPLSRPVNAPPPPLNMGCMGLAEPATGDVKRDAP